MREMAAMRFRPFDHLIENPESIFRLFEQVYGDSRAIRQRWEWEFLRHPKTERIQIFVAESGEGELVGMTVRMPCDLRVGTEVYPVFFATNSMVVPHYRGQGIIRQLYALAAESGALQLSKGTEPLMQHQLRKMGYREIEPNTYQVCLLAPWNYMLSRLTGTPLQPRISSMGLSAFFDYVPIDCFNAGFDGLSPSETTGIQKNADELNWRYIDVPHRRYECYARYKNRRIVSWCALRRTERNAILTDLRWNRSEKDEPRRTIQFAKALARSRGAIKLTCWATHSGLRKELAREFFMVRRESPWFGFFSHDTRWQDICLSEAHFVHGDGDLDYV
jgi:GNAT superfamily N-acetyltransferase